MRRKELFAKLGGIALALSVSCTAIPVVPVLADETDQTITITNDESAESEQESNEIQKVDGVIIIENDLYNGVISSDNGTEGIKIEEFSPDGAGNPKSGQDGESEKQEGTDDKETSTPSIAGSVAVSGIKTALSPSDRTFSVALSPSGVEKGNTTHKLVVFEADDDMKISSVGVGFSEDSIILKSTVNVYEYDENKSLIFSGTVENGETYAVLSENTRYIAVASEAGIDDTLTLTINGETDTGTEKEEFVVGGYFSDADNLADGSEIGRNNVSLIYDKTAMASPSVTLDKTSLSYLEDATIRVRNLNGNPNLAGKTELNVSLGNGLFVDTIKLPTFASAPNIKVYADDTLLVISGSSIYVNKTVNNLKLVFEKTPFDFTQIDSLDIALRNITSQSQTNTISWDYKVNDEAAYASGTFDVSLIQNTKTEPEEPDPVDPITPIDPIEPIEPDVPKPDTPDTPDTDDTTPEKPDTSKDTKVDVTTSTTKPKEEVTVKKENVEVSGNETIKSIVAITPAGEKVVLDYAGTESVAANSNSTSLFEDNSIESSETAYVPEEKVEKSEIKDVDADEYSLIAEADLGDLEESGDTAKDDEGLDETAEDTEIVNEKKPNTSFFDNIIAVLLVIAGVIAGILAIFGISMKALKNTDESEQDTDTENDKKE